MLTEADNLMISGTAMHHVSSEPVFRNRPNKLRGGPRNFANGTRGTNEFTGEFEIVRVLLIRRKEDRSALQPTDDLGFDVLDKMLSPSAGFSQLLSHTLDAQ